MRHARLLATATMIGACMLMAACAVLPSSGPSESSVTSGGEKSTAPYTLIKVTPEVAAALDHSDDKPLSVVFGSGRKADTSVIGVGDVVTVAIWEAAENGLFSGTRSTQGGAMVPEQVVSTTGTIVVPFAGIIKAAGRTPQQVKMTVEAALNRMAIDPQVLVNVVKNNSNAVTVTGEVAESGRIPLTPGGERLMDVIAMARGPRLEAHQLAVQLTRGKQSMTVPMEQLISDPDENIFVQPNDVVTLIRQPRSFTVFGATGSNASVPFDESRLYLNQALAKVGGLNDERANAQGIFVYRTEPLENVRKFVPDAKPTNPDGTVNVIYHVNLTDPSGFFIVKSFRVRSRDLIYVANSATVELKKFVGLIGTAVTPVVQGASIANNLSVTN